MVHQRSLSRMSPRAVRKGLLGVVAASSIFFVTACSGGNEDPAAVDTPASSTPAEATTAEASATETETAPESSSTETSSSATRETGTRTNASDDDEYENVTKAQEKFGSLAPDSLFAAFNSCDPNGMQNSMACSGDEVGQFQFWESDAKAASTTQLLTELRSSRVVEDTGRKVVGWSTLGNTAIITVVDNELGLVMQQMISTDEYEPRDRIRELGLSDGNAEPAASSESSDSEPSDREESMEATDEATSRSDANFSNASAE